MTQPVHPRRPDEPPIPTKTQRRFAQQLYLRHSAALVAFFRSSRSMALTDAVDLLQQTFSELLRTLARHPDLQIDNPRAFVFKLATRQFSALYRREQRRPQLDHVADLPEAMARDDLEYEASLRSEQRLVLRAMRRLTDDRRRRPSGSPDKVSQLQLVIYFRFWLGLTIAEVAEILEITPDAVANRQRRALRKLQRIVEDIELESGLGLSTSTTVLMRWREMLEREADGGERLPPWSPAPRAPHDGTE